ASLYNVYGPTPSFGDLDQAFSYVLNPNSSFSNLANVSVISNSWGAPEINDSGWYQDLEEAQARGISVLAISGDSGDSPTSPWGIGDAFFPGSMAYDTFGDIAVGGTTNTLNPATLHLTDQTAWYIADAADGGPVGTTGGISSVFAEPTWQSSTSADHRILGAGRGVPDLTALANNSLITLSYQGFEYQATNISTNPNYTYAWGTSIATPVEAGVLAEVDHVLQSASNGWVGFVDPTLYPLASEQTAPLVDTNTIGFYAGPSYASYLPTLPLGDVVHGGNHKFTARTGYDLATGWGSLDAYNLTMYYLTLPATPEIGHLTGAEAVLNLTGLSVTSSYPGFGI
ncbi:MAG: S8 family serine peptidase, partial [Thermoplasmata archaeon]|nr:S8 family serine peptidase [Thermoplasmata archaeon]